jgi:hypothetical protein
VCQEDDPCWEGKDCYLTGNLICGPSSDEEKAIGWAVWDRENGGRYLKVDPSRHYKVIYNGTAIAVPRLADGSVSITGKDGRSYVFTAVYTD